MGTEVRSSQTDCGLGQTHREPVCLYKTDLSTVEYAIRTMIAEDERSSTDRRAGRSAQRDLLVSALPHSPPPTISHLTETARVRNVQPGEHIYQQDEPVPLTLIIHGYGAARRMTTDGQQLVSGVAPAGTLFGYSGIASAPSSVELVALTACEVAQWPGQAFRALAVADPTVALAAIDSMAASLHQTVELIEGFLHQNARRRVLRILTRHQALFFGEPAILTRAHLPGLVGTSREMTGRVLRQLERDGIVSREGRTGLKLLRPDLLEGTAA
jgi:CRP/FNR family cyclic AMP-dependent transcriptional regulator